MGTHTLSNQTLFLASGFLVALGTGFFALEPGHEDSGTPGLNPTAAASHEVTASVNALESYVDDREGLRREVSAPLRLTVVCAEDGDPVAGATVMVGEDKRKEFGELAIVTSGVGEVLLNGPSDGSLPLEVTARGYGPWAGDCEVRGGECRVELHGMGAIALTCQDMGAVSDHVTATLRPVGAGVSTTAAMTRTAAGAVLLAEGLRPGAYYDVSLKSRGTDLVMANSRIQAGWPEATTAEFFPKAQIGQDVLITGIEPDDCLSLRVSLASPGREGPGSAVRWDANLEVGLATPMSLGVSTPNEIRVRGPLGMLLGQAPMSRAGVSSVALQLEHLDVAVVGEPSPADRAASIRWQSEGRSGLETAPSTGWLHLLRGEATPEVTADLYWGRLRASNVELPRSEPIEFVAAGSAEIRITDIEGRDVELSSVPPKRAITLDAVGSMLWAEVPAGLYQIVVEDESFGPTIRVRSDEIRHVSLAELGKRAQLRVTWPAASGSSEGASEGASEFAGDAVFSVVQIGSGNRRLRQVSLDLSQEEVVFADLPPGEVYVQGRSKSFGFVRSSVVLASGQEALLELPAWSPPRDVTVALETVDGQPLPNENFQIALLDQGQSGTIYGITDEFGEAQVRLAGGTRAMVGSQKGFCVQDLDPDATYLVVSLGASVDNLLTVRLRGWWLDTCRTVGVLRSRGGSTEFVPGRPGAEPGTFEVPRDGEFVLVGMLKDRSKIFVTPVLDGNEMILDAVPRTTRLQMAPLESSGTGRTAMLRLERVGGVDVRGTSFERALGLGHALGEDLELTQGAPLELVVEVASDHGGIVWRSSQVVLEPGVALKPIQLEVIQ